MPAIQPARLRQQAVLLAESFHEPGSLIRSLHHLMEFYADRAHRPGKSGTPAPLLPAYHVRPPVLRQLLLELAPHARQDPAAAFTLCEALWNQNYREFRLLAISLLGTIPVATPEPIFRKVDDWLGPKSEAMMIDAMLDDGFLELRRSCPQALLDRIESWLESEKQVEQRFGFRALLPLIKDPNFQNIPVFFRLLAPFCREIPSPGLRPDILDVISALAQRSPPEASYFLREILALPENPDTPWLIRNSLREFPPALQDSLRAALRQQDRQNS